MEYNALRIGIDVGGTFTDAVAIDAATLRLIGQAKTPTSHDHPDGVAHGIVTALHELLATIGRSPGDVVFLAHGTTQATNALLEGDVAPVGMIGIGRGPAGFFAKRLRRLGRIEIADGKRLPVSYEHLRQADDDAALAGVLDRFQAAGIESVVVTEPFSVDDAIGEERVAAAARQRGFLVTATHEITSLYGLSKRTRTAVLNAVILPRMFATADLVQASIDAAGITAPLMVMRCDGGVMSLDEMRRRPLLTVLSGPAAGVAGALMQEKLSDGLFLETGGTSTDISVIRRGKVAVQYTEFGGSSTYLSALDVRTVGVGGGSMVRIRTSGSAHITHVGPRSAHIAGLPYACFAPVEQLRGARLATVAPLNGDPADYAVLDTDTGRLAITMTCAANALGLVPEDDYAHAPAESARAALAPLAAALGTDVPGAARAVLDAGVAPVLEVVEKMVDDYGIAKDDVLLVGGGGGAASVTPHAGARHGAAWRIADHSEVISPIGVALALIREQVERVIPGATDDQILAVRREAEQAVIAQGAAPAEVSVDVTVDPQSNTVRAVATGATELRTQDRTQRRTDGELRAIAAEGLQVDAAAVRVLAATDNHVVFGGPERRRFLRKPTHPVRVLDRDGVVRFASADARVQQSTVGAGAGSLPELIAEHTAYGDGGSRAPALQLLIGPRIADLSGVLDESQLISLARTEVEGQDRSEALVAVLEVRS
ncbi:hydantoinase/oxoprolinase family protein [Curtobacterium sp. MCJR17_055]|uniref:hydantoinase/oxoprolinase family protein n=1 Tax=unclassified Curtobacterium TaxID=257496 RepID=UPI000D9BA851|nr:MULTISPECIES: hydantoinase/oxoprolinase family protein [unclassified Curtobacterium]PYY34674.1 hydantoinase/oxoprolinase family protein [Curtobacterium sp. MCBD17_029]PYY57510.1 hydantoinase/oxoprolinase family protein [Curtobacterium sp. MCPF17_015]PYY58165.1 hydantoinase/oxoprolinase family protein [Curtobacterium sp. MCJR17_055]